MTATPGDFTPPTPEVGASPPAAGSPRPSVERATAVTEELLDRGAPWSPRTSWTIVLAEGVIVAVVGLVFLFQPLGGSAMLLQLAGLLLLGAALIGVFQLWRGQTRPGMEILASFRAGSGITVGVAVVVATFFVAVTDVVTASLAVVVGIGYLVFGLSGIAGFFVRRNLEETLPLVALVFNAALALVGIVLTFAGPGGVSSVDGIFRLLGLVLILGGVALAGYGYMLRQREA